MLILLLQQMCQAVQIQQHVILIQMQMLMMIHVNMLKKISIVMVNVLRILIAQMYVAEMQLQMNVVNVVAKVQILNVGMAPMHAMILIALKNLKRKLQMYYLIVMLIFTAFNLRLMELMLCKQVVVKLLNQDLQYQIALQQLQGLVCKGTIFLQAKVYQFLLRLQGMHQMHVQMNLLFQVQGALVQM